MTTLSLTSRDAASVKADALVVGVASTPAGPMLLGAADLPAAVRTAFSGVLEPLGLSGKVDEVRRVPSGGAATAPVVVLTGVGPLTAGAPAPESVRRAVGAAVRELAGLGKVAVALPAADADALTPVAEGALLGAYSYTEYKKRSSSKAPVAEVVVVTPVNRSAAAAAVVRRAGVLAEAVATTRDLVNRPPVDLYPEAFADLAVAAAKEAGVSVKVLDDKQLRRGGYGGLTGVGMGSSRGPRLVKVSYAPKGTRRKAVPHLALVGKGITFDSGGLSIKPAASMETMKCDMAGAAAVLSTVVAVARLGLPVAVTGWLCLAENMPSGTAQRPSDVITIYGGRTVEVLNTDAEGRLVMADGLVAASEEKPDVLVDVATLTGAQMVALGNRVSAVMSPDDDLRARIPRVAGAAGEQFWPMPLPEELRASMDSPVADIANIGERFGGMLVAGLFLREFVGTVDGSPDGAPIPWAHLDIAGPAFNEGAPHGYTGKGGTGVGVRTLLALAEDLAAS